jgi:hypothetical protein
VKADDLIKRGNEVLDEFDPPKRSRQYVAGMLAKLAGTRVGGFLLRAVRPEGRWSADSYFLEKTAEHREWVRRSSSE